MHPVAENEPLLPKGTSDVGAGYQASAENQLVNRKNRTSSGASEGGVGDIHDVESAFTVPKGGKDRTESADSTKSDSGTKNNVTLFKLTVNLILCALGIGVLTQPKDCMKSGMVWAFISIVGVNIFNGFTNYLFIKAADKYKVYDMESLLELTSPRWERPGSG